LRRLIINADDLGLTAGVNAAIERCHREGVVTSSTLMANSAAFDGAISMAQRSAGLGIGCHVVLVDGQPVSAASEVPTLVQPNGKFRTSFVAMARAARSGKLDAAEIKAEVAAQITRIRKAGLAPSHVDTHKHIHMFAAVLRPLLEAAHDCGVRAVRNPFPPARPLAYAHLMRRPRLWTRYTEVKMLARLGAGFHQEVARTGMITTDGTFGVVSTGALDLTLFKAIIGSIPEGTWEFVCHAGYNDADLGQVSTRLRSSREQELEVLTSPAARREIEQRGIELISFRELAAPRPAS
jgi:hopanoid biosynthesis associated protein HpnK